MLPQSLAQNTIIGHYNSLDEFKINWSNTAPILNLNFFYEDRLVDESKNYRSLLRPWELIQDPGDDLTNPSTFYLHSFFYAKQFRARNNVNIPTDILVGSLVACVHISEDTNQPEIAVILPNLLKYDYNENTEKFELGTYTTTPSLIRESYVSSLVEPKIFTLNHPAIVVQDSQILHYITDRSQWKFLSTRLHYVRPGHPSPWFKYNDKVWLAFTKDVIFCNIYIPTTPRQLIYHTIVNISRKFNTSTMDYEYCLSIPNFNFPSDAILEYY